MKLSYEELTRVMDLREIAMKLVRERTQASQYGPFRVERVIANGVRIGYWPERMQIREVPSGSSRLANRVEITDVRLPPALNIDYQSCEPFGRVLSVEWDDDGNLEVNVFHRGEWEELLQAAVAQTVN